MDDLDALLSRLRAEHAKPKTWRSGLDARQAKERDEEPAPRPFPPELEAVERGDFLKLYTTEELCAYINRLCAETREATARAQHLLDAVAQKDASHGN
jgi:hypothetical protein